MAASESELVPKVAKSVTGGRERYIRLLPWVTVVALVVWVVVALAKINSGVPLIDDEPLYAARGAGLAVGWPGYRAPGLPLVVTISGWTSAAALRVVVAISLIGLAVFTGLLTRTMFRSSTAGWWACALTLAAPGLARSSASFLPDIPGALLAVVCVWLIARSTNVNAEPLRVASLWAVPVCFAANYMRFSASLSIGAACLGIAFVRRDAFRSAKLLTLVLVVGLAAATIIPNFVPQPGGSDGLSAWTANQELAAAKQEPLSVRAKSFTLSTLSNMGVERSADPSSAIGVTFLVLVGVAAFSLWRRQRSASERKSGDTVDPVWMPVIWLALLLLSQILTMPHFEIRYLAPVMAPVVMLIALGMTSVPVRFARLTYAGTAVVFVLVGLHAHHWMKVNSNDEVEVELAIAKAAAFVRDSSDGRPCVVAVTGSVEGKGASVVWGSKCDYTKATENADFIVTATSPEEGPPDPLFSVDYRYFDDESATWINERISVTRL